MTSSRARFLSGGFAVAALLALSGAGPALAQKRFQPTDIEVRAAFLYHFAQLVSWPETPEADPGPPIVIAILGPDPFGARLDATIGTESIRGRSLKLIRVPAVADLAAPPHILFVGSSDREDIARALAAVADKPVLTVGGSSGFARRGGMIEFRMTEDHRVTFDINAQAAAQAGLRLSSQLLKIARIVESGK